ncbi:MAG: glutamate-1-semialdehyde 2,1-aminomutase [Armatimonadetes bacterium]|nr:glutamate-1-semialdehyde 2,1-aminomutase [Armatimonadota bacterium]
MDFERSQSLFNKAQTLIPGGVNSPVRAFKSVGGQPVFINSGQGSRMFDVDGNSYVDYVCSWGPLIFGHAHPRIVAAITSAAEKGMTFGASTEAEVVLAEMIVQAVPSVDMVRLVSSGTEAVMSAIRLARGYTRRDKIIKFEGGYHGHSDSLLSKAGSGVATLGMPDSAGVPPNLTVDTITIPYNNIEAVRAAVALHSKSIACIILEPVAGNMGVVPPKAGFLEGLREICSENEIVLIFDEVITGFRVAYGGAQERFGVLPDLTTMGKIIGGGLPMGAYGGRREIMEFVAPSGPVYQAGTLSGNPLAVAAGIETLRMLKEPGVYDELEEKGAALADGLAEAARSAGATAHGNRVSSMSTLFFTAEEVFNYSSAKTSDTAQYAYFFHRMLERGFYFAPSQFEAAFVSTTHSAADIEATLSAARDVFETMKKS